MCKHINDVHSNGCQHDSNFSSQFQDRIKLQQVRLLIELFSVDDFRFITSAFSDVITNSKSKECGPLQLHDVNPAISCCECETKVKKKEMTRIRLFFIYLFLKLFLDMFYFLEL